jgi:hypothetical protein
MIWNTSKITVYDKWRTHWFAIHPPDVAEHTWNYLFTGGKEIRPTLFCELWHYLSPDLKVNAEIAFAIECIHVASTVLDDTPWMDNAAERRGKPTLHTTLSPKKALLITYELLNMARTIWKENCPFHINENQWYSLLETKLQRLVIGQYYDIEKKGTLIELASLKTGVLFELVAETVAMCTAYDTEFWKIWGNHLGILFQWMDDWQDQKQDIVQQNRNAFNEAYQTTLENYSYVWYKLEVGIGKQWFTTPFGLFMKNYFTGSFSIIKLKKNDTSSLLHTISIPYPTNNQLPDMTVERPMEGISSLTANHILRYLLRTSHNLFHVRSLETNLWHFEESAWEQLEEIKEWIQQVRNTENIL